MQNVEVEEAPPRFLDGFVQKEIVKQWNEKYYPGRLVYYKCRHTGLPVKGKTRSEAYCHSSGEPQICIEGKRGSYDLKDVKMVNPEKKEI